MELKVYNASLTLIHVIDDFFSLIWTDRYDRCGDFELVLSPNQTILTHILNGKYLSLKESDHWMIIEDINLESDFTSEGNQKIIVKGRSLESLLSKRIVWEPTYLSGNLQDEVERLLDENIINPTDTDRAVSIFEFEASLNTDVTSLLVEAHYFGQDLYAVISELCFANQIGFKILKTATNKFRFSLYAGSNRTKAQFDNPYVIFSPEDGNILRTNYMQSSRKAKTISLVAGEEGVGNVRTVIAVEIADGAGSDLDRSEMFTDAAGVTRRITNGTLTEQEYLLVLAEKGSEDLSANDHLRTFDGLADPTQTHIYGSDFFMGDVVQIENEYGLTGSTRVTEMIHSQDEAGIKLYPTFTKV